MKWVLICAFRNEPFILPCCSLVLSRIADNEEWESPSIGQAAKLQGVPKDVESPKVAQRESWHMGLYCSTPASARFDACCQSPSVLATQKGWACYRQSRGPGTWYSRCIETGPQTLNSEAALVFCERSLPGVLRTQREAHKARFIRHLPGPIRDWHGLLGSLLGEDERATGELRDLGCFEQPDVPLQLNSQKHAPTDTEAPSRVADQVRGAVP